MDCYVDLLIRIGAAPDPGRPYPVEAVVDGSAQHLGGSLVVDRETLLAQVREPAAYGRTLGTALLSPPIQRAYDRARSRADARCGGRARLRLQIDPGAGELQALRWERLLLPRRDQLVPAGIAIDTPFSRFTALDEEPPPPLDERPVRVLIAVANPSGLERWSLPAVAVEQEVANLWAGLSSLPDPASLRVAVLPGRTGLSPRWVQVLESGGWAVLPGPTGVEALREQMRRFHVVNLIAHGTYKPGRDGGPGHSALLLESADDGSVERVEDDRLADSWLAAEPLPRLVYLAACESAARADTDVGTFAGLGARLVRAGVPAVIAMQDQVPMDLSTDLTRRFFQSLLVHGLIDRALAEARWLLAESGSADWSIPVLYMRMRDGQLLAPDPLRRALAAMVEWSRDCLAQKAPPLPVEVIRAPPDADPATLDRMTWGDEGGYDLEQSVREILLAESPPRQPLLIVLGGEGSGKSIRLRGLVGSLAQEALNEREDRLWVPVLLDLGGIGDRCDLGLEELILAALQRFWPELRPSQLRGLYTAPSGPILVFLIDNVESFAEGERATLFQEIAELARRAPRHRFLAVCGASWVGRDCLGALPATDLLVVKRLSFRRVESYLSALKQPSGEGPDEAAEELRQALRDRRLFDLAGLPWLLFHMVGRTRQGRPPRSRTAVLGDFVSSALAGIPWSGGVRGRARESLRALALELQQRRRRTLSLEQTLEILDAVRSRREYRLLDMLDALVEARLLMRVGQDQIQFSYAGLQSYACADALCTLPEWRERIDDITATLGRLTRLRCWDDTLVLFAGMTEDIDYLVGLILAGAGAGTGAGQEERVFLAARCIEENGPSRLSDSLRGQVTAGLLHLTNADYEPRISVRIRAVRALQRLHDESAIPQLMRLSVEQARTNWMGRPAMEYSGVRLAAIAALRALGDPALDHVRAHLPELARLVDRWIAVDIPGIAAYLDHEDERVRPLAAFVLGFLSRPEADDILVGAFLRPNPDRLVAWALADALTLIDPARVTREAIVPFVAQDTGLPVPVTKEKAKAGQERWRQLAYLIGKTKPREPWAGRFLDRCMDTLTDVAVKCYAVRAFGDLLDSPRRPLLERLSAGDFEGLAMRASWSDRDRLWLRHEALEVLAILGDQGTAERLRRDRPADVPWPPQLELALFRTGEEIAARVWEADGESTARGSGSAA